MAPRKTRITADRDAAATGRKAAKARADAHFKKPTGKGKKAADDKLDGARTTLKSTLLDLKLPERRDYASHLASISSCKEKVATATGLLRNAKKRCKEAGIDPKEIDDAIYWRDKDPLEFKRWLAGTMRACESAGVEVPEFSFRDESGLSSTEKAMQDGHRAGLAGQGYAMNPHDPNSDVGRAWEEGRARGNVELAGKSFGADAAKPGDTTTTTTTAAPLFSDDDNDGKPWPDDEQIAAAAGPERALAGATH